jgi:hypothetical protein
MGSKPSPFDQGDNTPGVAFRQDTPLLEHLARDGIPTLRATIAQSKQKFNRPNIVTVPVFGGLVYSWFEICQVGH